MRAEKFLSFLFPVEERSLFTLQDEIFWEQTGLELIPHHSLNLNFTSYNYSYLTLGELAPFFFFNSIIDLLFGSFVHLSFLIYLAKDPLEHGNL